MERIPVVGLCEHPNRYEKKAQEGVAKIFSAPYHADMGDELLKRLEALEKRVADLEAKAVPVTPDLFPATPAPEPKVPTKAMIDRWIANRTQKGLGSERSMARHAAAFTDLYKRCNNDLPTALIAIDRYFKDTRHWVVERGWNLDLFQKMMDGLILEARRHARPLPTPSVPTQTPQTTPQSDVGRLSADEVMRRFRKGIKKV